MKSLGYLSMAASLPFVLAAVFTATPNLAVFTIALLVLIGASVMAFGGEVESA